MKRLLLVFIKVIIKPIIILVVLITTAYLSRSVLWLEWTFSYYGNKIKNEIWEMQFVQKTPVLRDYFITDIVQIDNVCKWNEKCKDSLDQVEKLLLAMDKYIAVQKFFLVLKDPSSTKELVALEQDDIKKAINSIREYKRIEKELYDEMNIDIKELKLSSVKSIREYSEVIDQINKNEELDLEPYYEFLNKENNSEVDYIKIKNELIELFNKNISYDLRKDFVCYYLFIAKSIMKEDVNKCIYNSGSQTWAISNIYEYNDLMTEFKYSYEKYKDQIWCLDSYIKWTIEKGSMIKCISKL